MSTGGSSFFHEKPFGMDMLRPAPAQPTPGLGQVSSNINPTTVFSPQMTQQAINQARATGYQNANLRYQEKPFMNPGVGFGSAGMMSAAMPQVAQAMSAVNSAGPTQHFSDAMTNAHQMLQGQQAQGGDVLGQYGNLQQLQGQNRGQALWGQGAGMDALGQLMNLMMG